MNRGRVSLIHCLLLTLLFFILIVIVASPALGNPDSTILSAVADAWVIDSNPTGNFGGDAKLRADYCCGEFPGKSFIYIEFDVSSIPAGYTVTGATLGIYLDSASGFPGGMNLIASRVSAGWSEYSITWNNKPGWSGTLDTVSVGTSPGWYQWTIPASVVQNWVDNPGTNHGIVIHWAGEVHPDQFKREFQSRALGNAPQLKVEYAPPTTTTTTTTMTITTTTTTGTPCPDTDGDGWDDCYELQFGTDPNSVDTDGDGIWDPQDPNPWVAGTTTSATTSTTTTTCELPSNISSNTFGGIEYDELWSVGVCDDGGYILAGSTRSFGTSIPNGWAIKVDANLNEQWSITDPAVGRFVSVAVSTDGYIFAGHTPNAYAVKFDNAGVKQWNYSYGGRGFNSVAVCPGGGYILSGITYSYTPNQNLDGYVVKIDASGNEQWNQTYGSSDVDNFFSVGVSNDGGYILAGWTDSQGAGNMDGWVMKIDSMGVEQWSQTMGGTEDDYFYEVCALPDGAFFLAGSTKSQGAGDNDGWVVELNTVGIEQWNHVYGGTGDDQFRSFDVCVNGYVLAGSEIV